MTDINKKLYDILVLSGYKIFSGVVSQNEDYPFVIYNTLTEIYIQGINNIFSDVINNRYQIDIYSKTNTEKETMKNDILTLLKNNNLNIIIYNTNNSNTDSIFRAKLDIKLWENN